MGLSNFPTSLDSITNKTDNVDDVLAAHINLCNDAIKAIEAKLGIDSSAVVTSIEYILKNASSSNPGHCFDTETELLTEDGWCFYECLEKGVKVLTLNKKTEALEWNEINEVFVYDNFKELYRIDGVNLDLLVTGGHGLVAKNKDGLDFFTAEELYQNPVDKDFVSSGFLARKGIDLTDNELRLLVWMVADGNMDLDKRDGKIQTRFKLAKKRKIKRLSALLDDMGISYSVKVADKSKISILQPYRITLHSESYGKNYPSVQRVMDFVGWPKQLPDKIKEASKEQVSIILEEYSVTDGSIQKTTLQIGSAKERELDLLQEMAITNGYRCNKTPRPTQWILSISLNNQLGKFRGKIKKVPYEGNVWCVNVDNGTLFVRRHGKVCITQNSHTLIKGATDVTATAAEINSVVDGCTATAAEINTVADGSNLLTFTLPASTTISAFGKTIVDDANAAAVRTTIGCPSDPAAGTAGLRTLGSGAIQAKPGNYVPPTHTGDVTGGTALTIAASKVNQAKLKTSLQTIDLGGVPGSGHANFTSAGTYGFYPQIQGGYAYERQMTVTAKISFEYGANPNTYAALLYYTLQGSYHGDGSQNMCRARMRYISASGEIHWIFVMRLLENDRYW
jgi:ribosomal protein L24E